MRNSQHATSAFSEDQLYSRKFRSLSARDLLDARDQFHVHLVHNPTWRIRVSGSFFSSASSCKSSEVVGEKSRKWL